MSQININTMENDIVIKNIISPSSVVLVCEHASHHIPASFDALGLSQNNRKSHAVWDIGALAVAEHLSKILGAALVASKVSRLVYDCNRPPTSSDAIPSRSEIIDVPGNRNLSQLQRDERAEEFYSPFKSELSNIIKQTKNPVLITIHSFTPTFHGKTRSVEIGILHDTDTRLANAMLAIAEKNTTADVRRNEPYGPEHGVTHTLKEHAIKEKYLNVMLEIRNDLISTLEQQEAMATLISRWVVGAFANLNEPGVVQCQA